MSIDLLFSITEIAIVFSCTIYIFTQCLLMRRIYLDKSILILLCLLFFLVIIQLPELNVNGLVDSLKLSLPLLMVFIAFQKPKLCLWVIIALLFLNSAFNFLYLKTFDKFSSFPFTFFILLFYLFRLGIGNLPVYKNKKFYALIFLFILIDIMQSLLINYRGQILYSVICILILVFKVNLRKKIPYFFLMLPVLYVIIMAYIGFNYFNKGVTFFEPAASNIERTGMIYYLVSQLGDYIFHGMGTLNFLNNGGQYKTLYGLPSLIPNDPHDFLLRFFISIGVIGALVYHSIFFVFFRRISFLLYERNAPFIVVSCLLLLQVVLIYTLNPFDAFNRLICGLTVGVVYGFAKIR
ncbi:O111 family O-antigen polymerase [Escherichia coli]|nr:O111 family O-antigen polymerase [Escherichia coli]